MKKDHTVVYVPANAKLSVDNQSMDAPKVKYERRKHRFDIDKIKKVIGGKYGRNAKLGNS